LARQHLGEMGRVTAAYHSAATLQNNALEGDFTFGFSSEEAWKKAMLSDDPELRKTARDAAIK